jgi:4-hydroxythreonine-4-phosphate dehydrogenase
LKTGSPNYARKFMSKSGSKTIGITLGDPAGIGPEVTAKALAKLSLKERRQFLVVGDPLTFRKYFSKSKNIEHYAVDLSDPIDWTPGRPTDKSGKAALHFLNTAVYLLKSKTIGALVTAPLAKESVCRFEPGFVGHTEYLAQAFGITRYDMMFVTDEIKSVIVTRHIPIAEVSSAITKEKVLSTIELTCASLKNYFGIRQPRIAVCGLNPHAGEAGLIGQEEIKTIVPAIQQAQRRGMTVSGPFSGDTMFVPSRRKDFHAIISMYHDQGLIAMKTMYFSKVVNLTVGLPFVRTSPAHGTAFDIAGKNKADASSMAEAMKLAVKLL